MEQLIGREQLHIQKKSFRELDINDSFFDSLKKDYDFGKNEFEDWFKKKVDEEAFVAIDDKNKLYGFLYFKTEDENEDYSILSPSLSPKKRLKIGTFKVQSEPKGQKMGERFLGFIFDNAKERKVDEIYVTIFERVYTQGLIAIFKQWGFVEWGVKKDTGEKVYVKNIDKSLFDNSKDVKSNFPILKKEYNTFFLPIDSEFHTELIPDSILHNEPVPEYDYEKPYRNALEKVYVSGARRQFRNNGVKVGDRILIYRNGPDNTIKKYTSVVTTAAVISKISFPKTKDIFFDECNKRSIFKDEDLENYWNKFSNTNLVVIRFIPYMKFERNVTLNELRNNNIIELDKGARPFQIIYPENFDKIIELSKKPKI